MTEPEEIQPPAAEQIVQQIFALALAARAIDGKPEQFNALGDDNAFAIKSQIQVLERSAKLNVEKPRNEVTEEVIADLMEIFPFYVTDAMLRAREWLDGKYDLPEGGTYATALADEWVPATEPKQDELPYINPGERR